MHPTPKMQKPSNRFRHFSGMAVLMTVLALTLSACNSGLTLGEAPFAQVTSWRIDGNQIELELRVRNINDEDLTIESVHLEVDLDDVQLFDYSAPHSTSVIANSFEIIRLNVEGSAEGVALLEQLKSKELPSIPFSLEGAIENEEYGRMRFDREGHIYNVPGRPGQFR